PPSHSWEDALMEGHEYERFDGYVPESPSYGGLGFFIAGCLVGAGAMFLLDPRGGSRRRALIKDKVARGTRIAGEYLDKRSRDIAHRAHGAYEERKAGWRDAHERIDDDVLVERVRAQIGHAVAHPGSIEVAAANGRVVLRGPVLKGEIEKI